MHHFHYVNDELYCENVSISRICRELGTPIFVYSRQTLERHFNIFQEPFKSADHLICYSMKACSNLVVSGYSVIWAQALTSFREANSIGP